MPTEPAPGQPDSDVSSDRDGKQVLAPSPVLPAPVLPAPVLPAPVLPAPVLPAPVLPAPVLPAQSSEDTDIGWGEYAEPDDDRLIGDRPPHWER
jgi:hypothetical protein